MRVAVTLQTVTTLWWLAELVSRDDYRQAAKSTLRACMGILERAPTATGQLLLATGDGHPLTVRERVG